jgi:hypothetical protein
MSARGDLFRGWAFQPVIDDVQFDERLILGGEQGVPDLESSGHLHAYVSVDDLDDVIADYNLRPASDGKIPNILLRAVSNLDAVPRQPGNPRVANAVVSAVDLFDDGDPRAVGEASEMIGRAVRATAVP